MLNNFKIHKSRNAGDVSLQYLFFAYNEITTLAEGILEFQEVIHPFRIQDHFESLGASCITVATFQCNDGNFSAASALNRVRKLESSPGFRTIFIGEFTSKLLAKAEQLMIDESQSCCPNCGVRQRVCAAPMQRPIKNKQAPVEEYDIVKKRRVVQEICEKTTEFDEIDGETIGLICEFSEAVSSALDEVSGRAAEITREELAWVQRNSSSCEKVKFGYVYAAWNPCFEELVKIGATMKDNPFERIKQLSGTSVPKSFELIACVPCADPFVLEKRVHSHFKSVRIQKQGRNTEFFKIDRETVCRHMYSLVAL